MQANEPQTKTKRTANACNACRQSKVKCSGSEPCANCRRRLIRCQFTEAGNRVTRPERFSSLLHQRKSAQHLAVSVNEDSSGIASRPQD
ncbi:hypothetical protein DH86_00002643, partial [Scytalidium sp. 3C]